MFNYIHFHVAWVYMAIIAAWIAYSVYVFYDVEVRENLFNHSMFKIAIAYMTIFLIFAIIASYIASVVLTFLIQKTK